MSFSFKFLTTSSASCTCKRKVFFGHSRSFHITSGPKFMCAQVSFPWPHNSKLTWDPSDHIHLPSLWMSPSPIQVKTFSPLKVLHKVWIKLCSSRLDGHKVGSLWHTVQLCISPGHSYSIVHVAAVAVPGVGGSYHTINVLLVHLKSIEHPEPARRQGHCVRALIRHFW